MSNPHPDLNPYPNLRSKPDPKKNLIRIYYTTVTAGYFYDTFAYEICFYGIYFYGIYIYGIYIYKALKFLSIDCTVVRNT
jgi:hypothetical protein